MKNKILFLLSLAIFIQKTTAQVGISTTNAPPNPSAMLDVNSTNKGLLMPRIADPSTTIPSPATGLMAYNTTSNTPNFYNGSSWQSLATNNIASNNFKTVKGFQYSSFVSIQNWTVPEGVTRIMVEAWGGGEAGYFLKFTGADPYTIGGEGGEAGAYSMNFAEVTPGQEIYLSVGKGADNRNAQIQFPSPGHTSVYLNEFDTGTAICFSQGGNYYVKSPSIQGESGDRPEFNYGNSSATSYDWIIKFGKGGNAYKGGSGGKAGSITLKNLVTPNAMTLPTNGGEPGGGGGGGYLYGGKGGHGMVLIYY